MALVAPAQPTFVDNNGQTNADNAQFTLQDSAPTRGIRGQNFVAHPIVYVDHILTPTVALPTYVTVQLTVNGSAGPISYFSTTGFQPGNPIRLAAQADGSSLPAGHYQDKIQVLEHSNTGAGQEIDYYGSLDIVHRNSSPFGSGWWLDSLYQVLPGTGGVNVVRGDGQAGWFASDGLGGYVSPQGTVGSLTNATGGGYLLAYPSGEHYEFNAQGQLTTYYDAQQRATAYAYNQSGNLAAITDPLGRVTTFSYTGGLLRSVTDFAGRVTWFNDNGSQVQSIALPDPNTPGGTSGPLTQFQYGPGNDLADVTDPRGNTTAYAYDFAGWVSTVTNPDSGQSTYVPEAIAGLANLSVSGYDVNHKATTVLSSAAHSTETDPLNHVTTYQSDVLGNMIDETDAAANNWTYSRDTSGRLTELQAPGIDQNGNPCTLTTSYTYDQSGHRLSATYADNSAESWAYDAYGNVTSHLDPAGNVTDYAYTYRFTSEGFPIITAEAVTQFGPQGQNRVTQYAFTDGTGVLPAGLLLSVTDPLGRVTDYQYGTNPALGSFGQVTSMTTAYGTADAATTAYQYDAEGDLIATTDPLNHTTSSAFGYLGRVTSQTDANGGVTSYTYYADGRVETLTDPAGNTTTWTYNGLGETATQTNAQGTESYTYDLAGELTSQTDRDGRETTFGYDALGRETSETWVGTPDNHTISYAYDPLGNVLSASDSNATYNYAYNAVSEPVATTEQIAGLTPAVAYATQYDGDGNTTQLAATVGGTADFLDAYSYDDFGGMTQAAQSGVSGGNGVAPAMANFTYNADGQFSTISRYADLAGTQLVATGAYGYDAAGRLNSLAYTQGTSTLAAYQWQYDAVGNVTQMLSAADATTGNTWGEVDYTYDATNQLTGATYTNFQNAPATESYSYSATSNGNRTNTGYQTGSDNQLLSNGTYTYSYDADGNETARWIASGSNETQPGTGDTDITTYQWDYRNRLTTVTHYATYGSAADKTVAYTYDAFNRMVTETVVQGSGAWTKTVFVYSGSQAALQFDSSGTSGSPGSLAAADLSHRYLWGAAVDQLLADEQISTPGQAGNVVWPLADNLGTIRDLATYNAQTGVTSVANHRVYDSFGNLASQVNPATGQPAAVDCIFGYTGKYFDTATGLQYNIERWYDPLTGRWASQDPSGFSAGDPNLYGYVGNSALNCADPYGLCA